MKYKITLKERVGGKEKVIAELFFEAPVGDDEALKNGLRNALGEVYDEAGRTTGGSLFDRNVFLDWRHED